MNSAVFPATTMPDAEWWRALWPDPGRVLVEMGVQPGTIVVDLCSGDGLFTVPLAAMASRVYAIDIDAEMIDRARAAAAEAQNCTFLRADAMDIATVLPEPVDHVLLANTFHGVPDKKGLARAVAATLKRRGRFGIINWRRRPREETIVLGQPRGPGTEFRIEPDDVSRLVQPAGLRLVRAVALPPYHYGLIFEKPAG